MWNLVVTFLVLVIFGWNPVKLHRPPTGSILQGLKDELRPHLSLSTTKRTLAESYRCNSLNTCKYIYFLCPILLLSQSPIAQHSLQSRGSIFECPSIKLSWISCVVLAPGRETSPWDYWILTLLSPITITIPNYTSPACSPLAGVGFE